MSGEGIDGQSIQIYRDYCGRHVYADDAEDIKRHPFFHDIPWSNMHRRRPPFVPKVSSVESTKYFDSEEDILGSSPDVPASAAEANANQAANDAEGEQRMGDLVDGVHNTKEADSTKNQDEVKKQQKKRPRDKLLRDPNAAKAVMEVRKKSAFLGYTYRRPKTWSMGDELRLASAFGPDGRC